MTSPWVISAGADRAQLDAARQAAITFTVTNDGTVDDRAVLDIVPGQGAEPGWFTVGEPQRSIPHGGSVPYLVKIAVPPTAGPGSYWVQARVYSSDTAPEESSVLSDRVAFDVVGSTPTARARGTLWLVLAAVVLVVAVLGVAGWLVLRPSGDDPVVTATTTAAPTTTTPLNRITRTLIQIPTAPITTPGQQVYQSGERTLGGTFNQNDIDLDELVTSGPSGNSDVRLETFINRLVRPVNGALIARVGPTTEPAKMCVAAQPSDATIALDDLEGGQVLCVRTNQQRLSIAIITDVNENLGQVELFVTTYQL